MRIYVSGTTDRPLAEEEAERARRHFLAAFPSASHSGASGTSVWIGWLGLDKLQLLASEHNHWLPPDVSARIRMEVQEADGEDTVFAYVGPRAVAMEVEDIDTEIARLQAKREALLAAEDKP